MNEEITHILSQIEDILNSQWMDRKWTAAEILQLTNGLEQLTQDSLEVKEPDEEDEDEDTDD
jgi:hypothetical protein